MDPVDTAAAETDADADTDTDTDTASDTDAPLLTEGVFDGELVLEDSDGDGTIAGDDAVTFKAWIWDPAHCYTPFPDNPRVDVDGLTMASYQDANECAHGTYGWRYDGVAAEFLDGTPVSRITLTTDRASVSVSVTGLRSAPTFAWLSPADAVLAPGDRVEVSHEPSGDFASDQVVLWREPEDPRYELATVGGAELSFDAPEFCADGAYNLELPARLLTSDCPTASGFTRCEAVSAEDDLSFAAQVVYPDGYEAPACTVSPTSTALYPNVTDGTRLVAYGQANSPTFDGGIFLHDYNGYYSVRIAWEPGAVEMPSFNPGARLAFTGYHEVETHGAYTIDVIRVAGSADVEVVGDNDSDCYPYGWPEDPDGFDGRCGFLWDVTLTAGAEDGTMWAWASDGTTVLVDELFGDLASLGLAEGQAYAGLGGVIHLREDGLWALAPRDTGDLW